MVDLEQSKLDVDEAQHLFSLCMSMAEDRLKEHLDNEATPDQLIEAAGIMMKFIATKRHGRDCSEIASIATSIDHKELN